MGRRSLKPKRTAQILDAFEQCIVKYGLQASTLEKIANEAGVNRGILRHYIGNRNDIIRALVKRFLRKYQEIRLSRATSVSESDRVEEFIDFYFKGWFEFGRDDDTIFVELISASERDENLRKVMLDVYRSFEAEISNILFEKYPHTPVGKCRTIAYAIMCLTYGHSTMWWLGFDPTRYPDLERVVGSLFDIRADEVEE